MPQGSKGQHSLPLRQALGPRPTTYKDRGAARRGVRIIQRLPLRDVEACRCDGPDAPPDVPQGTPLDRGDGIRCRACWTWHRSSASEDSKRRIDYRVEEDVSRKPVATGFPPARDELSANLRIERFDIFPRTRLPRDGPSDWSGSTQATSARSPSTSGARYWRTTARRSARSCAARSRRARTSPRR